MKDSEQPMSEMISAGDAKSWHYCRRRFWFDHNTPPGFVPVDDPFDELIKRLGIQHEQHVKERLGGEMPEAESEEDTRSLMDQGVSAIYQPVLVDHEMGVQGRPDFLVNTSDGYQVADAKLARSLDRHKEIKIQLGTYRKLLKTTNPALLYLGNGEVAAIGDEVDGLVDEFITDARSLLDQTTEPEAYFSESKCAQCPYDPVCRPRFVESDQITMVYGVDRRSVSGLAKLGINTIGDLAAADPDTLEDVPYLKGRDSKNRAILQARSLKEEKILPVDEVELPAGTWVHFDVESNPVELAQQVYLWGLLLPPYSNRGFVYAWNDGSDGGDRRAWQRFLEQVSTLRDRFADLVLAHFTPYEVTQIKRYSERYPDDHTEIVGWLLDTSESPLFDLSKPVKETLALPIVGYGLKQICKDSRLVNFKWELAESGSQWSVVRYVDYLNADQPAVRYAIKREVLAYNRDDVKATRQLELWLRARPWEDR